MGSQHRPNGLAVYMELWKKQRNPLLAPDKGKLAKSAEWARRRRADSADGGRIALQIGQMGSGAAEWAR